jgi:hypothetical protein
LDSVAVRIQGLEVREQMLVLARLAQSRSGAGSFRPVEIEALCDDIGLPRPSNTSYHLRGLANSGLTVQPGGRGPWKLTPKGRQKSVSLAGDMDLTALLAETQEVGVVSLGDTAHPVIPPSLAPPELLGPLHSFLAAHPFETNVFGMTRFPDDDEENEDLYPVAPALEAARKVCEGHGLTFHLASDRQIVDDLWPNVAAHIWACRYGIAFFEDRRERGINYNLTIEVGSMIVLGRRVAILKDRTIDRDQKVEQLPSDLTGRIYKPVDLDDIATVRSALGAWIKTDLSL